jgi:hypothetical protein
MCTTSVVASPSVSIRILACTIFSARARRSAFLAALSVYPSTKRGESGENEPVGTGGETPGRWNHCGDASVKELE